MKVLLAAIPFIVYISYSLRPLKCHSGLSDVGRYLGSKAPYRFIANVNSEVFHFDGCRPDKIVGFIRHGTRTPSEKIIQQMKQHLPRLKETIVASLNEKYGYEADLLCSDELKDLTEWPLTEHDMDTAKWLVHEGEDEMTCLAERFQERFPQLLPKQYLQPYYYFRHTQSQRAEQSAKYFAIGLFGRHESKSVHYPETSKADPVLRFYKICDKWTESIKKNPKASVDHSDFKRGAEMKEVCEQVSRRLGLNTTLPIEDVHLMYSTCSFETSWNKKRNSAWCSIFSQSDFEVLQYVDDLKHYWRDGYGHELSYRIACPAIRDIFSVLDSDDPANSSAVFYFTHSGTILKLLSRLGLYQDPYKLTSDLPKETRANRLWRTSLIDAFGSNLVFISYNCGGEKKVLTMHQERPVLIPGCPSFEKELCPLSFLRQKFHESLHRCNFDEMCSVET